MATLPKHLYQQKDLQDLDYGQKGFTVPWAMFAGPDGELYLSNDSPMDDVPGGTVTMLVENALDGLVVDVTRCDHKWLRQPNRDIDNATKIAELIY